MSDLQTNVSVKVVNQASEPLTKISADIKEMNKTIESAGKDSGLSSSFSKLGSGAREASKDVGGLSQGLGGFVGAISPVALGASAIGAAFAVIAKNSISLAQELQSVNIMTKVVFGEDFPRMNEELNKLSVSLGRNESDLAKFASSVTTVATGLGVSKKAAEDMSLGLTELAVGFGKAFNVSDQQVMDAFKSALEGNTRGLREFNIVLNDNTLQEYLNKQGIDKKVASLDEASKAIVTYNYLLDETGQIQAAGAENTGNLADQTKRLSAEWNDLEEKMGTAFLPAVTAAVKALSASLGALESTVTGVAHALQVAAAWVHGTSTDIRDLDLTVTEANIAFQELHGIGLGKAQDGLVKVGHQSKLTASDLKYSSAALGAMKDDAQKLEKAMKDLGKGFDDTFTAISQKSKDLEMRHNQAVDGIVQKQGELYSRLNELRIAANSTAEAFADIGKKFKETMADLNTNREDRVVAQFQRVKDLYDSLQRSVPANEGFFNGQMQNVISNLSDPASGKVNYEDVKKYNLTSDQEQMVNLTLQLHKEQQALKDYLSTNLNLSDKLKSSLQVGSMDFITKAGEFVKQSAGGGVARGQQSDFTLAMEALKKQAGQAQQEYDKATEKDKQDREKNEREQQKVKDEIATLDKKRKAVEYAYQQERAEIGYTKVALGAFHDDYLVKMQNMSTVTQQTVDNVKVQLEALRQALQQAQQDAAYAAQATSNASSRGTARAKFADGGIVGQRAGGMDVTVAEGMYNEAIVPLPDGRSIPVRIEGSAGGGHTINVNLGGVVIKNGMDVQEMVRQITTAVDNQLLKAR